MIVIVRVLCERTVKTNTVLRNALCPHWFRADICWLQLYSLSQIICTFPFNGTRKGCCIFTGYNCIDLSAVKHQCQQTSESWMTSDRETDSHTPRINVTLISFERIMTIDGVIRDEPAGFIKGVLMRVKIGFQ